MKLVVTENLDFLRIVEASEIEHEQIQYSLRKRIRGHFFNPLVKKKLWDGYIPFCKNNFIPIGLWMEVVQLGEKFNFPVEIAGLDKIIDYSFNKEHFVNFITDFFADHPVYKPRDYQIDSAAEILKYRLCSAEIATSAGKTLIVFMIYAYLKSMNKLNKIAIIVPNTTLVMQLKDDWEDYNNGKLKMRVRQVYGGSRDDDPRADVIVGTFQSLCKKTLDYFKGVNVVFADECLHPDTYINMGDGSLKKIKNVNIGDVVETINEKTGIVELFPVKYVYKNLSEHENFYEIETDDGRILKLTGNHKVMMNDLSWKRVDELKENDEVKMIYKKNTSYYDDNFPNI